MRERLEMPGRETVLGGCQWTAQNPTHPWSTQEGPFLVISGQVRATVEGALGRTCYVFPGIWKPWNQSKTKGEAVSGTAHLALRSKRTSMGGREFISSDDGERMHGVSWPKGTMVRWGGQVRYFIFFKRYSFCLKRWRDQQRLFILDSP